jgi:hypothetical protein
MGSENHRNNQRIKKMTYISKLILIAGLIISFSAICADSSLTDVPAEPLSLTLSAQRVQGRFNSSVDQAKFEQALKSVQGASIKLNHPDDALLGDGAPRDQFGYSVAISGTTALIGAPQDRTLLGVGSAYVFTRIGSGWQLQAKLTAADAGASSGFGNSVALEGDTAVVGAYFGASATANSGAAYVFTRSGDAWSQQAKLTADDASGFDYFGVSIAISGDSVLIGAHQDRDLGERAGSAYVFSRTGTSWNQQAKLLAANGVPGDFFGGAVALSGNTAAIGAPRNDAPNAADAAPGSVYIFVRNGTIWSQQAQMYDGTYTQVSDHFGRSVAVSGDAILVGAPGNDAPGDDAGSAYFFTRTGSSWNLATQLFSDDVSNGRRFGISVALSADGAAVGSFGGNPQGSTNIYFRSATSLIFNSQLISSDAAFENTAGTSVALSSNIVLVGTPLKNTQGMADAGAASVFTIGPNGPHQALLTAGDGAGNDQFGTAIAVFGDTALVGVPFDDVSAPNAGSAMLFTHEGDRWLPRAKLSPPDPVPVGGFGLAVALSGDTAVVGAPQSHNVVGIDAGAAYVFTREGALWSFQAKLNSIDGAPQDLFGGAVAIAGDTVVIGARGHDLPAAIDSGAAYVFTRNGANWSQQAKLVAGDAASAGGFGADVAVLADTIVVGAPQALQNTLRIGAAYIYARTGAAWSEQLKLTGNDTSWPEKFGQSVALSDNSILVGAPFHRIESASKGAAYVYVRNGPSWSQQALLLPTVERPYAGFGFAVSLSDDTALIGAPHMPGLDLSPPPPGFGAAYVYNRNGTAWSESTKVTDSRNQTGFGNAITLAGAFAWVGAPMQHSLITGNLGVGTVHVFSTEQIFQAGFEN